MSSCLAQADFEALENGALDEVRQRALLAHLEACGPCRLAHDEFRRACDQLKAARRELPDPGGASREDPQPRFPRVDGYSLVCELGRGGMGVVYQAVQTNLNRTVALKLLPTLVGNANPQAVARFRREATAAARLHHTNIIPIHEFGESHHAWYYTMELVNGLPLNEVISRFAADDV